MSGSGDIGAIVEQLRQFMRGHLAMEDAEFDEHTALTEAGIDSFSLVEVLLFVERTFGVRVPDAHLTRENLASLTSLARCIGRLTVNEVPAAQTSALALAVSALPARMQLTGGDYFLQAIDRRIRRAGMPGNLCRIIIKLEGRLDTKRLRQRVKDSPLFEWLARVRLVRRLPMLLPQWRLAAPAATLFQEHDGNRAELDETTGLPPAALERDLLAGRNPALALDLVSRADGTAQLVFSWQHALMDVHGVELLLRHLLDDTTSAPSLNAEDVAAGEQTDFAVRNRLRRFLRKARSARRSLEWINESCREPLFSLLPSAPPARACQNHYRILAFTAEETERIDAHCQLLKAGFRRSHFHLAACLKAVDALARRRAREPGAYLIPVPHDLRRPEGNGPIRGPIFSNQLSFLFYRIESSVAANMPDTIDELTRQMKDQAHGQVPESFAGAMEMFKPMPLDFYLHRISRPTRGKFASFFFTDSGESCAGLRRICGGRVLEVTHLAPAARPPGLTILFSRFQHRLTVSLAWVNDCLSTDEINGLEHALRAALLGKDTA